MQLRYDMNRRVKNLKKDPARAIECIESLLMLSKVRNRTLTRISSVWVSLIPSEGTLIF